MKTYTRCWCCSLLKEIDLDAVWEDTKEPIGRLCEDCIAKMEEKEDELQ